MKVEIDGKLFESMMTMLFEQHDSLEGYWTKKQHDDVLNWCCGIWYNSPRNPETPEFLKNYRVVKGYERNGKRIQTHVRRLNKSPKESTGGRNLTESKSPDEERVKENKRNKQSVK